MNNQELSLIPYINLVLENFGVFSETLSDSSYEFISGLIVLLSAVVIWVVFRLLILVKLSKLIGRSSTLWDDHLSEAGFFRRIINLIPGVLIFYANGLVHPEEIFIYRAFFYLSSLYIIFVSYLVFQALLTSIDKIYQDTRFASRAPITGFIQVGRLITSLVLVFLVLSLLMGQSPVYLLSGLTAIAAVLLLIFRDTILGFVSGIQIAANRMFNNGDWIEMPKYNINGEIQQIGLTIVKVQNWDKTISTIPTYALTVDAVKNWRGMSLAKGRRIKRTILIDVESIEFASPEQLDSWSQLSVLKLYLKDKEQQLLKNRQQLDIDRCDMINARKLTNIGTFRAYIEEYLKNHVGVRQDMICMVRHLEPSEVGLPIEVYCFAATTEWVKYEHLQADIFDHIFATMPLFSLKPYQRVTNEKR